MGLRGPVAVDPREDRLRELTRARVPESEGAGRGNETVALPQFYFCWSSHGLFGTGYGVRAASRELQALSSEDWQRYVVFCDYVPEEERQDWGEHPDAPITLARYRLPERGYLIARKSPGGRRGTYFVHCILDEAGRIDPAAIASSESAGFWATSDAELDESTKVLPELELSLWDGVGVDTPWSPLPSASSVELEAALLELSAARGEGRVARVRGQGAEALAEVRGLLGLLPSGLAAQICFSTYEARDRSDALDVVAAGDLGAVEPGEVWPRLLVAAAREDPSDFQTIREDPRVTDIPSLVSAVRMRHGEMTPDDLRTALDGDSPFVDALTQRADFSSVLAASIDQAPEWWEREGLNRLFRLRTPPQFISRPEVLLASAAERSVRGSLQAAAVFTQLYKAVQPHLSLGAEHLHSLGGDSRAEMAYLLLRGEQKVNPETLTRLMPLLVYRWSRIGTILRELPEDARTAALRRSILEGEQDGVPEIDSLQVGLVVDVVCDLCDAPETRRRTAVFLAMSLRSQRGSNGLIAGVLKRELPPEFVRGELSEALRDEGIPIAPALRGSLLQAGTADHPDFYRLVAPTSGLGSVEAVRSSSGPTGGSRAKLRRWIRRSASHEDPAD
jgi:hypothetical protein